LLFFLFFSPFLSFIFNGLQYPSYRWGMFFNVSLVIVGIIGLDSFLKNISKPRLLVLILTPIFYLSLILLSISNFPEKDFINPIFKVILIFSLYLATIFLLKIKLIILKVFYYYF
jgi:hypothetical protein